MTRITVFAFSIGYNGNPCYSDSFKYQGALALNSTASPLRTRIKVAYLPSSIRGKVSAKILVVIKSTGRSYKTDRERARLKVARGTFTWRDQFTIEEVERRFQIPLYDGPMGVGNAIPFSHVQSKYRAPEKLHYEIPAAGAHTRPMHCAWNNFVPDSYAKGGRGVSPERSAVSDSSTDSQTHVGFFPALVS